jgi:hypothetical protein
LSTYRLSRSTTNSTFAYVSKIRESWLKEKPGKVRVSSRREFLDRFS